ncbi:hypothetical protein, conserved [Plasmodium vivax]|nr:hypothetical protein, conserved [Plasmodium vivax]
MGANLFNAVSSFPEYDSELSSYSEGQASFSKSLCESIVEKYGQYDIYDISKTCPNAMNYLTSIKQKDDDIYFEKGCLYLYFWLYRKSQNISSYIETTLSLFKDILNEYGTLQPYTSNFNTEIIDNLMYEKLSFVYTLNDYYNKYINKSDCENDNCKCARVCAELYKRHIDECNQYFNSPFCIELTKFREKFNEQIKKDDTCNISVKSLPPFKNYSLETIIVIPIIVISVIGFIVFTLYRFTPFAAYIHKRKRTKTRTHDNFDQMEEHIQNISKYGKGQPKNRKYNISYYNQNHS